MNKVKIFFILIATFALASCGSGDKSNANASAPADTADKAAASAQVQTILFFGDSLTAGYGLDDPADAFPGVIAKKIDSLKLPYKVINAGVSGETSAGGNGRIDWTLKQKVDIFILELGANDGLRGISPAETTRNLQSIIDKVKVKYPNAKLVMLGMQVPPNMGADYVNKFKAVFPTVAAKNKMALVPFLLQGVGGHPDLNQGDGIHPTEKGAKIVAGNVWSVLKGQLDNPKAVY
ncbi:arylesterase [Mucilaginibacter sp. OK283]|jgi:acyl-CoA thioesterase-1|uniref:arylesterase n=1 Tax=Mucilaginibacter sp. OK283 TaxID=1881049 RepID=UPI0008CDD237|nr:arylesterase [Mucilaginibacter sp. OK283]SEP43801.1 acyl-CoA thioesterase-1 [Mucilaginibacter sp. OK283]